MTKSRDIRCFDYVNHPYAEVRDALAVNALEIFRSATRAAASRAQGVASQLRVELGGMLFGKPLRILRQRGPSGPDHAAASNA